MLLTDALAGQGGSPRSRSELRAPVHPTRRNHYCHFDEYIFDTTTTTTKVLIIVTLHKVAGALYISDLKN